jgi:hypothetical protein
LGAFPVLLYHDSVGENVRDVGEPLKTFVSSALVRRLAGDIARVHPGIPVRAFTSDAWLEHASPERRLLVELPPAGRHDVGVIVNGRAVRAGSFDVSKP